MASPHREIFSVFFCFCLTSEQAGRVDRWFFAPALKNDSTHRVSEGVSKRERERERAKRASEEAAVLGGPRIKLGEPWSQQGGPQSQLGGP